MLVTVISDASYCPKHKVAGYGFWIASARRKLGGSGRILDEVDDTNSAEMMAVCNAVWHGIQEEIIQRGDSLLLQTDSLAAIDRLRNDRVVNVTPQQEKILAYFEKTVRKMNLTVQLRHVKGHTIHPEGRFAANRACDKKAKEEMRAARRDKILKTHVPVIKELLK